MRKRRSRSSQVLSDAGIGLVCAALVAAPLLVGSVHRVPMILLMATCALALASAAAGASTQRPLRASPAVVLPLVLLIIPILQSIPLPFGLRGLLDREGNDLLLDNALTPLRAWPLSLDPSLTREHVGKAAAAVAMFLIAYHLASGQTKRHLVLRLVGLSGVAATVIGLGHRFLGFTEIYGLCTGSARSLLMGPFVNANHTAEFLELAAFACLACSYQRANILNRYGWLTGTLLCAAGAIATLSRGAVMGLLAGSALFAFLRRLSKEDGPETRRGVAFAWAAAAVLLIGGTAAALGASGLIDRFRSTSLTDDVRFQLWRDAFRVLRAHPAGIGRGAFEHVYPIYRTVTNWFPISFAFLESHPLQLLVDSGWLMFGAILAAVALVLREIARRGRRDRIEAALLAGLFAVVAHSFVDFGLETLGVALPFAAILGSVVGRGRAIDDTAMTKRSTWALVGLTCAALLFGVVSIASSSADDFDKLLKKTHSVPEAREVLKRAQATHPMDYYYAFAYARFEPLRSTSPGPSPRLHALNRALRLCPGCEQVHAEVARTLWRMGNHSQSLIEWRASVQTEPAFFDRALAELWAAGAKPTELAAMASFDAAKMVETADFLATKGQLANALTVLDEADLMSAPRAESLLTRCRLQTQLGHLTDAETTLAEARAAGIQDPRLAVLEANIIIANKADAGANEALSILDLAATRYPLDVAVQRLRVSLVSTYAKWQSADRAIDGFKLALFRATGTALEANVAAARIRARLSQWNAAFSEYRIALTQSPGDASLWVELARTAESAGRDSTAREAYAEASRLAPADTGITGALRRVEARQGYQRSSAPPTPGR